MSADGIDAVAVAMARSLRALGVAAPPDATVAVAAALGEVGLARRSHVYWAGRATLVQHPEDIATYDRVFGVIFDRSAPEALEPTSTEPDAVTILVDGDDEASGGAPSGGPEERPAVALRWSDCEALRAKDFAACTAAELDEVHRLMTTLRLTGARRPSRRTAPTRRPRGAIDRRATTRRALHTGGEPLRTVHRRRVDRPRRTVLLVDVSGSMEVYARALVRFAHASVVGRGRVEVFTLGTRCTRITRELRSRDPDAALRAAGGAVADWSGGTRLGEGLQAFNDGWGLRGMARGATVAILSDGWDRGAPDLLAEQVQRLQRVSHRLVWVNPLKAGAGFTPTARGMAAALPHLDALVEGHSLAALDELADVLAR